MPDMTSLQQVQSWLARARWVGCAGASAALGFARVHTDSRSLEPGDLFVALRGERFDANEFLAQAKARGAVAAICQESSAGDVHAKLTAAGLPGLLVTDAKLALAQLATHWRAQFKLPLIAVTGSNGKTTVTQMIAAILRAYQPQAYLATQGNLNNHIGVPLTLLRLRAQHQIAVVELGMNHPGEIATLATMAQPSVALVNNAQREHLEFMATVQAVAQENAAVIDALPANGVAVFPADDLYSALWSAQARPRAVLRFGLASDSQNPSDVYGTDARWVDAAWSVTANTVAGPLHYRLHIAGQHNVKNSLAAVACCLAAGVPLEAISQGLAAFEPVKGRSRALTLQRSGRSITLVDDSYNANPDSVRAAIEVLASLPGPRLLVLGDMGEVGDQGPLFHAEAGDQARQHGIDALFTLGESSIAAGKSFVTGRHFADMPALQAAVLAQLPQVGSVLVKGSRFMRMERVVQAILQASQNQAEASHAA